MRVFRCLIVWILVSVVGHGMQASFDDIPLARSDSEGSIQTQLRSFSRSPLSPKVANPLSLRARKEQALARYHAAQRVYLAEQDALKRIINDWIDDVLRRGPAEALKDDPVVDQRELVSPKTSNDRGCVSCDCCFRW